MPEYSFEALRNEIEICVSDEHKFGTDAFLLADFASPRHKDKVCDLGTGCGIVAVLMQISFAPETIYGVDIQSQAINQLKITVEKNSLDNIIPVCADLKVLWKDAPVGSLDVVTCNPPYKAASAGIESLSEAQRIARHEITCDINDVCRAANRLLKYGGLLKMCNRPERLADVICAMRSNKIEPKSVTFVFNDIAAKPWLFLISGKKGANPGMTVEKPLVLINEDKSYTEEYFRIYE